MDRAELELNGIFIEDGTGGCDLLPPHVESLQNALLDFRQTIPDRFGCTDDAMLDKLRNEEISKVANLTDNERTRILDELESCAAAKELARHHNWACRLNLSEYSEDDWKKDFEDLFLSPLAQSAETSDMDTRQTSRTKFYYDAFQQARDRPWTMFGPKHGFDIMKDLLPEPKPSWAAHFPIYVVSPADCPYQRSGIWQLASSHSIADNFSQITLEHLSSHGLQSSATGVTKSGRRGATLSDDYVCYPWLTVEHMKDEYKNNKELCYSQAAVAGRAALKMLQNLCRYEQKCSSKTHIPPVVTVTTEHDLVRVWIMHCSATEDSYEMQLIWSGTLTLMVDILALKTILENCHTWATRVLKPWISRQIDLWKQQCPKDCPKPFEASLRYRASHSTEKAVNVRPRTSKTHQEQRQDNSEQDQNLRRLLKEEHNRLLNQLSEKMTENTRPTRLTETQTDAGVNRQPPKSDVGVTTHSIFRFTGAPQVTKFPHRAIATPSTPRPSFSSEFVKRVMSETKGKPTQEPTDRRQHIPKSHDIFKSVKKVSWKGKLIPVKLPDVSSEDILASKPWLRKAIRSPHLGHDDKQVEGKAKSPTWPATETIKVNDPAVKLKPSNSSSTSSQKLAKSPDDSPKEKEAKEDEPGEEESEKECDSKRQKKTDDQNSRGLVTDQTPLFLDLRPKPTETLSPDSPNSTQKLTKPTKQGDDGETQQPMDKQDVLFSPKSELPETQSAATPNTSKTAQDTVPAVAEARSTPVSTFDAGAWSQTKFDFGSLSNSTGTSIGSLSVGPGTENESKGVSNPTASKKDARLEKLPVFGEGWLFGRNTTSENNREGDEGNEKRVKKGSIPNKQLEAGTGSESQAPREESGQNGPDRSVSKELYNAGNSEDPILCEDGAYDAGSESECNDTESSLHGEGLLVKGEHEGGTAGN
ncbi:hypothetical protein NM208_g11860 [Fusarium decemcellulare]|uniref:Uncharacterized protein n=1 Tax=Fusarium decemcellulare TaxID=57161 RepID=A0ACC1RTJ3_9HYPO|nr:hypothetical protein NM208_g11860 [Fusarium decemcellulare]